MTSVDNFSTSDEHFPSSAYLKIALRSQEYHRSHLLKVRFRDLYSQKFCVPMLVFSYSISVLILITACFALPSQNVTVNNSNNGSLPELPSPDHISCLPRVYGVNPKKASCVNAWEKIPRTITEDMYTSRSRATTVSITIPIRYQSDDGRCVIDVRAKRRDTVVTGDLSRGIDISDAAGSIIDKCMQPQSRFTSGGSIYGFSEFQSFAPC